MRVVEYEVKLLEPVLAGRLNEDENTASSLDYLPGSMLRGAIIGKYMRAQGLKEIDAGDLEKRRLFFDGTTRYLNAYPLVLERRSLPMPFSWYRAKGEEGIAYDFGSNRCSDEKQWMRVPFPFCLLPDDLNDKGQLIRPEQQLSIHIARNRRKGTAYKNTVPVGEEMGALFRYRALAKGQYFKGAIVCNSDDADKDAEFFKGILSGETFLGKSSRAGYGRVLFENVQICSDQNWREIPMQLEPIEDKIYFTLVSDALIRDDSGHFSLSPIDLIKAIGKQLGVQLELQSSFLREQLTGGFNRKWGLPLPQAPAFAMGSVFVCKKPDCDFEGLKERLLKLESTGIGMRRIDGYGRVLVNWQGRDSFGVEEPLLQKPDPVFLEEGTYAYDLAQRMLSRMARKSLDRVIIDKANKVVIRSVGASKNQFSRLRLVIREVLYSTSEEQWPNLSKVRSFITEECKRKTAKKFYKTTQFDNQPLKCWLESRLDMTDYDSWHNFFVDILQEKSIGNVKIDYPEPLRKEYLLRYIDAVIAKGLREVE